MQSRAFHRLTVVFLTLKSLVADSSEITALITTHPISHLQ